MGPTYAKKGGGRGGRGTMPKPAHIYKYSSKNMYLTNSCGLPNPRTKRKRDHKRK